MAEEIYVDIKVNDKQLKDAVTYAEQLVGLLESPEAANQQDTLNKKLNEALKTIEELKKAETKSADETLKFGIKKLEFSKLELQQQKELLKEGKKRATAQDRQKKKEIAAAEKVAKKLEAEEALLSKQAETYDELAGQTVLLTKKRKGLNLTTEEGVEEFNRLTGVLAENNAQLKTYDEEIGNFQRNVGDYKQGIADLVPGVSAFKGALTTLATNPFFAVVAVAVVAVTALANAFTKTEKGQKLAAQAAGVLNAGLSLLVKAAEGVATFLEKAFTDPQAAVGDLWETIKTELVERLNAVAGVFVNFGSILKNVFTGNFKEAGTAAKEFGKDLLQATTGIDTDEVIAFGDELARQAALFADLEVAKLANRDANRALEISISKLTTSQEILAQQSGDATISLEAQKQANIELQAATDDLAKKEAQKANATLQLINKEVALKKANGELDRDLLDAQKDALIAAEEANRAYTLAVGANAIELRQIQQGIGEQTLDFLIDGSEARKAINERIISDERTTAEERRRLVEENRQLAASTLEAEVATLQGFTDKKININALLNESDAKALDEKAKALGLSEILTTRLLEVVKEQAVIQQDLNETEKDANEQSAAQALEAFERQQEIDRLTFESKKRTAEEIAAFEISAEIAKYTEELRLKEEFNLAFGEKEQELLEAKIKAGQADLDASKQTSEGKIKLKDAEVQAVKAATDSVIAAFGEESAAGKAAAIFQKAVAIGKTSIAIAEAIAQSAKIGFPQNIVTIAGAVGQTAGLLGTIKSIKFAKGGVLDGPSHAQGGIPIFGGRVEAEGGEPILTKAVSANPYLLSAASDINVAAGGDPLVRGGSRFASGGILPTQDAAAETSSSIASVVSQPVLVLDDLLDIANDRAQSVAVQEGA